VPCRARHRYAQSIWASAFRFVGRWAARAHHRAIGGLLRGFRLTVMSILAINVRNQFRGKIKEIIEGPVVSEVDVETPAGLIVTSVITTRSIHELGLKVGKDVVALVKSTEVSIATL
jgi:molybdopterin-binding protein